MWQNASNKVNNTWILTTLFQLFCRLEDFQNANLREKRNNNQSANHRLFLNPNPQDPPLCSSVNVNGGKGLASLMTNGFKCLLTGIFDKFFRTYFHMGFFMSILHMRRLSLKEIMSATQSLKARGTHGCRYLLKNMSTANNRFKCLNKPPY